MYKFELLDSKNEKSKWLDSLKLLSEKYQDVYFLPEYFDMNKLNEDTRALLFKIKAENKIWIYAFFKNKIKNYDLKDNYFDIETPHGYGGPLANTYEEKFLNFAQNKYFQWCKINRIVCEFIRFHPLFKNHNLFNSNSIYFNRETTSLNLKNCNELEKIFKSKVLNMIRSVKKNKVNIEISKPDLYMKNFVDLYLEIMKKNKAEKFYHFNVNYFKKLFKLIEKNGFLVTAIRENEVLGAAIFLTSKSISHYHLSATNSQLKIPGVTNAMIYFGIKESLKRGLKTIHLGGGKSTDPNDSLLKFKRKMSNTENKFYIGKKIHNKQVYNYLKSQWMKKYPQLQEKYQNRLLCYKFTSS